MFDKQRDAGRQQQGATPHTVTQWALILINPKYRTGTRKSRQVGTKQTPTK